MIKPRVVIDTNVVISAALNPVGLEAQLMELLAKLFFDAYISEEILSEYLEVLSRPKFARLDQERIRLLLTTLVKRSILVSPIRRLNISIDEPDNRFYECAAAANS